MSTPSVRFPEFKEPWEPQLAGNAFSNRRERGEDGLPIYSVTIDRGMVPRDSLDRDGGADASAASSLRAHAGDLAYNTMRMWQGAVGIAQVDCIVSPAYVILKPNEKTDSEFFGQWFQNSDMIAKFENHSHGLTKDRLRLYYQDFAKIPIFIPSLHEQRRIADALSAVDTKIDLLQRKKTALEQFKIGLMQKLFSQEIRFTREDGSAYPDWKEKTLSEIATIVGGGTPSSHIASYWSGDILWFTPTEIKRKYLTTSVRTISEEGLDRSSAKMLPVGALLLSTRATVGDVGIAMMPCCTNQGFQSLIVNDSNTTEFWYYWLIDHKDQIIKRASGSTFREISKKALGSIPAMCPSKEEQERIAGTLAAFDEKIDAISRQVTTTQAFKKGLLQQMFI